MYHIRSTYDEWAPEYDDYPDGRDWPGPHQVPGLPYAGYADAWTAVAAYLVHQHRWQATEAHARLAPYGHREPTARYGDTTIINDAETIEIHER